jgi:hypothetical protein
MIGAALSRSLRVRAYREAFRDAGQTFCLAPGVDLRAAMKRAALAAVPKGEGWTLRLFTLERTTAGERIATVLDGLACGAMEARTSPLPWSQPWTVSARSSPSRQGTPGVSNGWGLGSTGRGADPAEPPSRPESPANLGKMRPSGRHLGTIILYYRAQGQERGGLPSGTGSWHCDLEP